MAGLFFSILVIFFLGELITRVHYCLKTEQVANPPYDHRQMDSKLGWITKPNYSYEGLMTDQSGADYKINIKTNQFGFRTFGSLKSQTKPKVLFIGDSYTHAVEVSNSKLFYNILADTLSFDCFAYGSAGYGNLQEYLILDLYIDKINPDIIILQLCSNDFIDNYAELELASNYKIGKKRPYLTSKGEIVYTTPVPTLEKIKGYSTFVYFIGKKIENIRNKFEFSSVEPAEKRIVDKGREFALFDHAADITELILQRFKERIPDKTRFLVFDSDHYQPQYDEFKVMCQKNNIQYIENVGINVKKAQINGAIVRSHDGYHWNEAGHQIVADAIFKDLHKILHD